MKHQGDPALAADRVMHFRGGAVVELGSQPLISMPRAWLAVELESALDLAARIIDELDRRDGDPDFEPEPMEIDADFEPSMA